MRQVVLSNPTNGVLNTLTPERPPGTFTSYDDEGNAHIYMFGFYHNVPGVWEMLGGGQVADDKIRLLLDADLVFISDLSEPYEMKINTRRGLIAITITLED